MTPIKRAFSILFGAVIAFLKNEKREKKEPTNNKSIWRCEIILWKETEVLYFENLFKLKKTKAKQSNICGEIREPSKNQNCTRHIRLKLTKV